MLREFGTPRNRMKVNYFGVDADFWSPDSGAANKGYILSVGNDFRRDYELLLRVAATMPSQKFVILTRIKMEQPVPPNVEIMGSSWHTEAVTDIRLRELYRGAACIVVTLKESHQPSGQSVALQSMACGKPVVLTRTSGLWHKELMRDGENVRMVEPADCEALKEAVEEVLGDLELSEKLGANGRELVCQHFTIENFAAGIESMCREAMNEHRERGR